MKRGSPPPPRNGPQRFGALRPVLILLLALPGGCSQQPPPAPAVPPLQQARDALADEDFDTARRLAGSVPRSSPDWASARLIAAEAALKAGDHQQSLEDYLLLASEADDPQQAAEGLYYAAEVYRDVGRLDDAVRTYQRILRTIPDNAATHERLAFLLSACGRNWEAQPHYWSLVRSGTASLSELALFADLDRPSDQRRFLETCREKSPQDPLVRLGLAAHDYWDGDTGAALALLEPLLEEHPHLIAGQAIVGEARIEGAAADFLAWHRGLPEQADRHPEIWYVRGLWARREGALEVAARCFWEAARRAPAHRRSMYQLGQILTSLQAPGSEAFRTRADELIRLTQTIDTVLRSEGKHEPPLRQTVQLLEQMGRIWEACGWALLVQREFPQSSWPSELFSRLAPLLNDTLPITRPQDDLARQFDLSHYPSFDTLVRESSATPRDVAQSASGTAPGETIAFAMRPLEFQYDNAPDPQTKGARQFEQTGGGVAAIDYDGDAAPDLFFTQGCDWPTGATAPVPSGAQNDSLFRNRGGTFIDVTGQALPREEGFGQGCAVGDFDNDGFDDLYIANVGGNQLLRNMGDGTFVDVTADAKLDRTDWTTSVLVADLNLDGLPDLFDVNYLQGPDLFTRICDGLACSPSVFSGAPDQLWINRGDGSFENVPFEQRIEDAKGLGIVALPIGDDHRLSLFIANDQVPNFLLRNRSADTPHRIRLQDEAFITGLAYNDDGLAMACMGIAADDVDGDGLTDLLVTNFSNEPNTLYRQDAAGLFVDASNVTNLEAASYPYVGWGAQFLDADLDGNPDLVLTNGHVDDYTDAGGEYHMRPQFFVNRGEGRFAELFAETLGEYFAGRYLGRGLARLDADRNGLMDFAVSHIGEPALLVLNETSSTGRFLNLRLHAVRTARDAIGTRVTVRAGEQEWTRTLLAGDGYQASNERMLQFGLGDVEGDVEVEIHWPSGAVTRLSNPPLNHLYEVVEQQAAATRWDGDRPASFRVDPQAPDREPPP